MQPANQTPLNKSFSRYCCFRYANPDPNSNATPLLDTESGSNTDEDHRFNDKTTDQPLGNIVKESSLVDKLKELLVDPDTGRRLQADNVYIYSDGKTRNGKDQARYGSSSIACCYPTRPVWVKRNNNIANIINQLDKYILPTNSMTEQQLIKSIKTELECPILCDRMNIPGTLTTPSTQSIDKASIDNLLKKKTDPFTNKIYNVPIGFIDDKLLWDINALEELKETTASDVAVSHAGIEGSDSDRVNLMRCVLCTIPAPSLACVVTGSRNSLACASLCALSLSCFACLSSIAKQCVPSQHWCAVSIYKHVLSFLNSKGMSGYLAKLLSDSVVGMIPYAAIGVMIGACATGCCVVRTCNQSSVHSDRVRTIEAQRN